MYTITTIKEPRVYTNMYTKRSACRKKEGMQQSTVLAFRSPLRVNPPVERAPYTIRCIAYFVRFSAR